MVVSLAFVLVPQNFQVVAVPKMSRACISLSNSRKPSMRAVVAYIHELVLGPCIELPLLSPADG